MVSVQMIHESAPSRKIGSSVPDSFRAFTIAFITYNGEVPISPKTIPNDTKTPMKVSFLVSICAFSPNIF